MALDVDATFHVDVEDDVLACAALSLHLFLQRAIEAVFIYLLILQKLVVLYLRAELLGGKEEILHAILLGATRRTTGTRDGEIQIQLRMLLHQPVHNGRLATARRCTNNNQPAPFTIILFHLRSYLSERNYHN